MFRTPHFLVLSLTSLLMSCAPPGAFQTGRSVETGHARQGIMVNLGPEQPPMAGSPQEVESEFENVAPRMEDPEDEGLFSYQIEAALSPLEGVTLHAALLNFFGPYSFGLRLGALYQFLGSATSTLASAISLDLNGWVLPDEGELAGAGSWEIGLRLPVSFHADRAFLAFFIIPQARLYNDGRFERGLTALWGTSTGLRIGNNDWGVYLEANFLLRDDFLDELYVWRFFGLGVEIDSVWDEE